MQPVFFLSHGSPTLPFDETPARDFMIKLGQEIDRPKAIIIFSAHWYEKEPHITASAQPETIHDFFGFKPALYELQYHAPGAPDIAAHIRELLQQVGFKAHLDEKRGLDHGAWNPLMLALPKANIPIIQVSLIAGGDEAAHINLGKALAPLREENCLIMASGGAVHNLRAIDWQSGSTPSWAIEFDEWLRQNILKGNWDDLIQYKSRAPSPRLAHPSDDHLLPLFCALGAAMPGAKASSLHQGFTFGSLSMAAYRWD